MNVCPRGKNKGSSRKFGPLFLRRPVRHSMAMFLPGWPGGRLGNVPYRVSAWNFNTQAGRGRAGNQATLAPFQQAERGRAILQACLMQCVVCRSLRAANSVHRRGLAVPVDWTVQPALQTATASVGGSVERARACGGRGRCRCSFLVMSTQPCFFQTGGIGFVQSLSRTTACLLLDNAAVWSDMLRITSPFACVGERVWFWGLPSVYLCT
jgi:hypothetical protein